MVIYIAVNQHKILILIITFYFIFYGDSNYYYYYFFFLRIRSNTLINNQEMALSAKTKTLISERTDFIQTVKKE